MAKDTQRDFLTDKLRAAGLKVTGPRLAVLEVLHDSGHLDAESVYAGVSKLLPNTSLQAVYGVLAALALAGLVRKIEPAGSPALYEVRVGDNHHHLVCLSCKNVTDVDCVIGESPCLTPSDMAGFSVQTAEVTFWGLCAACQLEPAAP